MTTNSMSRDADGYERLMGRWSRRLIGPFLEFVGAVDGERVLDAGCGPGHLAATIAQRCPASRIDGVDLSSPFIAWARENHHDPRVRFEVGDIRALAFAEHTFDRVLSLLVLHFVAQTERAITELRRVAKPGATIGAAVWDARGGFVANRMFFDTAAAIDPRAAAFRARNHTRPLTRPGELGDAWRRAGLKDVIETTLSIRMEFADFTDYWTPYEGDNGPGAAYMATLDDAGRAKLRDAVRAAYVDGEEDGPRSYAALAWAVKGTVA